MMKHLLLFTIAFFLPFSTALPPALASKPSQADATEVLDMSISMRADSSKRSYSHLNNRESDSGVYYCSDVNWKGNCTHRLERLGFDNCLAIPGDTSSFGPDAGFKCILYGNGLCRDFGEGTLEAEYPGYANLVGMGWNDKARSYSCGKL